jgi:hypothetical protein
MPYAFKLLCQELETYMNIGMRIMTEKDMLRLNGVDKEDLPPLTEEERGRQAAPLQKLVLPEAVVPEYREVIEGPVEASPELLMKLGALPPATPRVSDEDDIVVDGTGVQNAIRTAAEVAASQGNAAPGVVPGTMVQTQQGPVFQPNPTTVTVVPPARTIQVVGGPEEVEADEVLGAEASQGIPSILPKAQPNMMAQQAQGANMMMSQPMFQQQQGGFQGQFYGPVAQMPMPYGQGINMSQSPMVYAASQPQPAQLYTSGVPGAPPTIAVSTDDIQMGGFLMPQGPKPMRNNITLKRKSVSFGNQQSGESPSGNTDPGVKITVIKGA